MKLLVVHRGTSTGLMEGLREAGAHVDEQVIDCAFAATRNGMLRYQWRGEHGAVRDQLVHPKDAPPGLITRESFASRAATYDSVLILKGMQFSLEDIEWLRERADLTHVLFDTITCGPPGREREHGERALRCTRAIATGREAVEWLRARSERPVAQIIQGFRPRFWLRSPQEHTQKNKVIAFTGSAYTGDGGRGDKLSVLRRERFDVAHYGCRHAPLQPVYFENASRVYNRAAIVLNFVPGPGTFSNRVVRVLASGGCLLSEYANDLTPIFGSGLVQFRDDGEMIACVRELLGSPSEREAIAEVGHARAKAYTWAKQGEKYLRFIRGEHVVDDGGSACTL